MSPGREPRLSLRMRRSGSLGSSRLPGSRPNEGNEADAGVAIHLVPGAMEDVRLDGIW